MLTPAHSASLRIQPLYTTNINGPIDSNKMFVPNPKEVYP
jgi:hypothetical protein